MNHDERMNFNPRILEDITDPVAAVILTRLFEKVSGLLGRVDQLEQTTQRRRDDQLIQLVPTLYSDVQELKAQMTRIEKALRGTKKQPEDPA